MNKKIEELEKLAGESSEKRTHAAFRFSADSKKSLELLAKIRGLSQVSMLEELIAQEVNFLVSEKRNKKRDNALLDELASEIDR